MQFLTALSGPSLNYFLAYLTSIPKSHYGCNDTAKVANYSETKHSHKQPEAPLLNSKRYPHSLHLKGAGHLLIQERERRRATQETDPTYRANDSSYTSYRVRYTCYRNCVRSGNHRLSNTVRTPLSHPSESRRRSSPYHTRRLCCRKLPRDQNKVLQKSIIPIRGRPNTDRVLRRHK